MQSCERAGVAIRLAAVAAARRTLVEACIFEKKEDGGVGGVNRVCLCARWIQASILFTVLIRNCMVEVLQFVFMGVNVSRVLSSFSSLHAMCLVEEGRGCGAFVFESVGCRFSFASRGADKFGGGRDDEREREDR